MAVRVNTNATSASTSLQERNRSGFVGAPRSLASRLLLLLLRRALAGAEDRQGRDGTSRPMSRRSARTKDWSCTIISASS
jgi:hypothetical protein